MRLQIEKPVYGGSGLAHTPEGRAVFVPFTLPGETIEAELRPVAGGRGEAELVTIEVASSDRVVPGCVHFGICGGCQYQHASYPAQLRIKQEILMETLARGGLAQLPTIAQHSGEPWQYRNRIRLRASSSDSGLRVGYNRRGTNDFLPVRECPIAARVLWRAAKAISALAAENPAAARWFRSCAEIELACSNDESRLEMTLLLATTRSAGFAELCERLRECVPELVGAGAVLFDTHRSRATGGAIGWGAAGLPMVACGRQYWVSRGSFFQVNRSVAGELVRIVAGERSGKLMWDLFAGVGLFTRALAGRFGAIVAVEAAHTAATDLERAGITGVRTLELPVLDFLRRAALDRERPELIVLDPPRAGLSIEGARLLAGMRAHEIAYISCDPTTLARDLRVMVDSGYNLAELHLVDMFPQTFHLETVAVLKLA